MRNVAACLSPLLILILTSCQKTISKQELYSEVSEGISSAREAAECIDHFQQQRLSHNFASGHLKYLADEVSDSEESLLGASSEGVDEQKLRQAGLNLNLLSHALVAASAHLRESNAVAEAQQTIGKIESALVKERDDL